MTAASAMMVTLVNLVSSLDYVRELISSQGLALVEFLLRGVAGGVDRSRLELLVDIFHALCVHCITELSGWLHVSMVTGSIISNKFYI